MTKSKTLFCWGDGFNSSSLPVEYQINFEGTINEIQMDKYQSPKRIFLDTVNGTLFGDVNNMNNLTKLGTASIGGGSVTLVGSYDEKIYIISNEKLYRGFYSTF
jgi:hypothetical protein